ncbi:MAG: histidine kinase [Bacteroidetes bacterium]|nr:histidine kinase [Bacteroidota bacterium]
MVRVAGLMDELVLRKRWLIHLSFWIFVLVLYSLLFGQGEWTYWKTLFFVALLMPVTIVSTYFLNYFLVPRYLLKERYGAFLMYFIYTLVGAMFLEMCVVVLTFIVVAGADIKGMSPSTINLRFLLAALLMIVFLGVAVKMMSHWRKSKEEYQALMREKIETELKFLKTQLNPHFLFNTLNNLYYLASEKSDRAPKAIMALSELLDYVINEARQPWVPLEREIRFLRNYIDLEQLRYDDRLKLTFDVSGNLAARQIAPMMLVTLVENCFKHGPGKSAGRHWMDISITCAHDFLSIRISNSKSMDQESNASGIGLSNLRHQLSLLYPDRHELEAEDLGNGFTVNLKLT